MRTAGRLATIAFCAAMAACGNGPADPSPASFAGEWSGTTFQGGAIRFTVSAEQRLTGITVDYNVNGCTGSKSFTNVNAAIEERLPPTGLADFAIGPQGGPDTTAFHFFFTSPTTANGFVAFVSYSGCGNGGGGWTATKR